MFADGRDIVCNYTQVNMKELCKYLWAVINLKLYGLFVFHMCAAQVPRSSSVPTSHPFAHFSSYVLLSFVVTV
jgi:hypothetical protein